MVIIQYSHTKDVDDDGLNDDVLTKVKLGVVQKDLPQKGE